VTIVPTWAALTVSIGTPLLTFVGVLVAQRIARVGAAELAVSGDPATARLGVAQLRALNESNLLDLEEQGFIDAALTVVVKESLSDVELARDDALVIPLPDSRIGSTDRGSTELSLIDESAEDEGGEQ